MILALPLGVHAATTPSGFSIKAILPENQVSSASYFDLQLTPGEKQVIQLQVNNSEDKPIVANVELNPASTGLNGTIIYSLPDVRDESMAVSITDIARVSEPVVEIPPHSSATVDVALSMTDRFIDGTILGGLRVTAEYPPDALPAEEAPVDEEGVQISNKYAYVIGLKLRQNETEVQPDFQLLSLAPRLVNHSVAVAMEIRNSEAAIAKDIRFSARIYKQGSDSVLKQLEKTTAEMAPNSACEFLVDWENRRISPGTYRALIRMEHQDRVWEWDEEFTVDASAAEEVNSGALGLEEETPIPTWVFWIVGLLLLVILLLLALLLRRRKPKTDSTETP